ncbi:hypothetical protein ACWDUH_28265, partial [Micromonospora wenchangensis]
VRPASPAGPQHDPEAARHSSDDPAAPRSTHWPTGDLPTSAPPAVQVPPVGTAASGFEVPPGFHAPERGGAGSSPDDPRDRFSGPDGTDRSEPTTDAGPPGTDPRGGGARGTGEPSPGERRATAGPDEPDWSGPSWNRPSWGGTWAPAWSRDEEPPAGRRARAERAAEWSAEAARPYEPVRAEPARPYQPVRAEPARPYEPVRSEVPRPYELTRTEPATPPALPEPTVERSGRERPAAERVAPGRPGVEHPERAWSGRTGEHPVPDRDERTDRAERHEPTDRSERDRPGPDWSERSTRPEPDWADPAGRDWSERSGRDWAERSGRDWSDPAGRNWSGPDERDRSPVEPPAPQRPHPADRPGWSTGRPAEAPRDVPAGPPPLPRDEPAGRDEPGTVPLTRDEPTGLRDERAAMLPAAVRAEQPFRLPRDEPAPRPATSPAGRAEQPFRLRSVPTEPAAPTDLPGHPPEPAATAGAPATSGPRRLDQIPSAPAPTSAPPYAARRSAPDPLTTTEPVVDGRRPDRGTAVLPQRVPAEPDVPVVPEPPAVEPPAETPELARIATHLRRDDEPAPLRERPEGFDVNAILDAVREVAGVRDAALRRTPAGAHSLRLDLSDGADPAEVSRLVARLLQERMGLAAAPQSLSGEPSAAVPPPMRRRTGEPRVVDPTVGVPTPATERPAGDPARSAEPPSARPGAERPAAGVRADAATGSPARDVEDPPAEQSPTVSGVPRRRRQSTPHRGRASVEETLPGALPPTGSPATLNASYSGGQMTTTETAPSRPLDTGGVPGPRVVIDHVQVSTFGLDANVEVRLLTAGEPAAGHATGPAVDGYVLRLCAVAAAAAVDELLRHAERTAERGRCFVEHAAVVPFGNCEVATVVVLLVCDGWVEQLAGSALVSGDPRQAVVRATLAAVNRRLEALLA